MARGMLRGAAGAWLGLIMLQALTTKNGSGAVGGLLGTVDGLVKRALDPAVAAIPDHSGNTAPTGNAPGGGTATLGPDGQPNGGQIDPRGRYIPPSDSTQKQPNPPKTYNESYIPWPSVPGLTTA